MTIDEDKATLESMASRKSSYKQTLTSFEWVIIEYRRRVVYVVFGRT